MKSLTVKVHPLAIAAFAVVAMPVVAIAAGTVLAPPVTATGSLSTPILTVTQSGAGYAGNFQATTGAALGAINKSGKTATIGGTNTGSGPAGYFSAKAGDAVTALNASTTNATVAGVNSSSGMGGFFQSGTGRAVYGVTTGTLPAVSGINNGAGDGGYFQSSTGEALHAFANTSTSAAFAAINSAGQGGYFGAAGSGVGLQANSATGPALVAVSSGAQGLLLQSGGVDAIDATDMSNTTLLRLDNKGNLIIHGTLTQNGPAIRGTHSANNVGFENVGTGEIRGGIGHVAFEQRVQSALNSRYAVFLTPLGDTRGLYVSEKSLRGFVVRETGGGRSTLSFDYRIVGY